jgi:hypothetical protein
VAADTADTAAPRGMTNPPTIGTVTAVTLSKVLGVLQAMFAE